MTDSQPPEAAQAAPPPPLHAAPPPPATRSLPPWVPYVLAVVLLLGATILAVILIGAALNWLTGLSKELLAALITGLISVITLVVGRLFERNRERETRLRERKTETYEQFMIIMIGMLLPGTTVADTPQAVERRVSEAVQKLSALTPQLIIWASDPVISQWSHYRQFGMANPDTDASIFEFERILLSIRKDLGHANNNLKPGDVLAFFLNDVREVLARRPDLAK